MEDQFDYFRMPFRFITDLSTPNIYPNRYLISYKGDVYDLIDFRCPSIFTDNLGYLRTYVKSTTNEFIMILLHRVIKIEFDGYDSDINKNIVDHIDANKNNINIFNLEWVTQQENIYRAIRKGLYCINFILDESDVPDICKLLKEGKSYNEISNIYFDKYKRDISDIVGKIYRGERWKHISKNYMPFPKLNKSLIIPNNSFYTIDMIHRICYLYDQNVSIMNIAKVIKEEYNLEKDLHVLANSIGEIKYKNKFYEISKNYNFKKV